MPVKPIYMNWNELTKHYLVTDPIKDLSVRIIHPTKSMLGKRLHSTNSDRDIPSKRKKKAVKSGLPSSQDTSESMPTQLHVQSSSSSSFTS
jgi:hypothetical protein